MPGYWCYRHRTLADTVIVLDDREPVLEAGDRWELVGAPWAEAPSDDSTSSDGASAVSPDDDWVEIPEDQRR